MDDCYSKVTALELRSALQALNGRDSEWAFAKDRQGTVVIEGQTPQLIAERQDERFADSN